LTTVTRRFTAMAALVAMMMFGAIAPAAAQMDSTPASEASPSADFSDLNEPDAIYGRFYMLDTDTLTGAGATPSVDLSSMPPIVAIVQVYEFATDDDAASAVKLLNQKLNEEIGTKNVQSEDVENLGDMAVQSSGAVAESGIKTNLTTITVQQDNVVYVSVVGTFGDSSADVATSLVEHMMKTDPGDAKVMFSDDGTSTGGYFDVFPTEGDDLVQGMIVSEDMYSGANAEATPTS